MEPQQVTPTIPPQPVPIEQKPAPSNKTFKITFLVFLFLLLATVITYAFRNYKPQPQSELLPKPEDVVSPTPEEKVEWKTYSGKIFSFKYPLSLVLEEREKDYLVLLANQNDPMSVLVSIDARLKGPYANYENAIKIAKAELVNVKEAEINNGVKISGIIESGYGEGMLITQAFFKYKESAIGVDANTNDTSQLQIYDQILLTFKFLE